MGKEPKPIDKFVDPAFATGYSFNPLPMAEFKFNQEMDYIAQCHHNVRAHSALTPGCLTMADGWFVDTRVNGVVTHVTAAIAIFMATRKLWKYCCKHRERRRTRRNLEDLEAQVRQNLAIELPMLRRTSTFHVPFLGRLVFRRRETDKSFINSYAVMNNNTTDGGRMFRVAGTAERRSQGPSPRASRRQDRASRRQDNAQ
ncbi:hypothetical protein N7486_000363 [Penicillium sp. IBT 16267x]|nr:hypothetical protein N7486_000363 [Penicillium sp. IBT 16267x]